MSKPTRLLDELELSDDERRALTAGLHAPIPSEARGAVWSALGRRLPLAAAGAALGATATKTAAAVSLVKMALAGVALGTVTAVAVVGGEHLLAPSRPKPPPASAPSLLPSAPLPLAQDAEPAPKLDPTPELPSPSTPPEHPRPNTPDSTEPRPAEPTFPTPDRSVASFPLPAPSTIDVDAGAALESRRVAEARSHLRAGDARGALTLLDALRRDFPRGVLAQERDALAIEALLALGERAKARAAATRFFAQYPASPHAASVKRALE